MSKNTKLIRKQRIFEARFEQGYRYLDRCGDAMLILEDLLNEETKLLWFPEEMAPSGARLICPDLEITLVFDTQHLVVDQSPVSQIEFDFTQLADSSLAVLKGRFGLGKMKRFGSRRIKLLPADSIEDAERMSVLHAPLDGSCSAWSSEFNPNSHHVTSTFELPDHSKGIRVRTEPFSKIGAEFRVDDRLKLPPHHLPTGQHAALVEQLKRAKKREHDPEAGLLIDIDFYHLWPEDVSIKLFIQEGEVHADALERAILERNKK